MIYAAPDQKAQRIACLLAEEVVPCCGVPEAVLSDRGTNLLSHLVQDVCGLLGMKNRVAPILISVSVSVISVPILVYRKSAKSIRLTNIILVMVSVSVSVLKLAISIKLVS